MAPAGLELVRRPRGLRGRARRGLIVPRGGAEQGGIPVGPRLVVVVQGGEVRVEEEVGEGSQPPLEAQRKFLSPLLPPAPVLLLVLPERGIAGARPGLDGVPPAVPR